MVRQPTLVRVDNPRHRLMSEEIFGPILTVYVYEDSDWDDILKVVDSTGPYALRAVFAQDRAAVDHATAAFGIRRKLLHQRQAHWCCCRSSRLAAQGAAEPTTSGSHESDALDFAAHDQGKPLPTHQWRYSFLD